VNVRRSPLSQEVKITYALRCYEVTVCPADERDRGFLDLLRGRFLSCEQLPRVRDLDAAAGLRFELDVRFVRAGFSVAGVCPIVSLSLAVAVSDDEAAHRLANVQQPAGRARSCERHRKKKH
jgi:hypothetical protein